MGHLSVSPKEAELILEKALTGGETDKDRAGEWLNERFIPNTVFIDEKGYAEMCIDALKILAKTSASDYGSSRQRDLGQLWADMTRGYLGELAFKIFLKSKYGIDVELGHEAGDLKDYLPADIHSIKSVDGTTRAPKIRLGIKTTKWNGIWMDLPGDQFNHSDAHIFIKVGTGRDHLFSYFKKIGVFDKIFQVGKEIGHLTDAEVSTLYDALPTFRPIPAYICGFVQGGEKYPNLSYGGSKGRKNYTITRWSGPILPGDLEEIKKREGVGGGIKFEGIGDFSHDKGYLFNTGNLSWKKDMWDGINARL